MLRIFVMMGVLTLTCACSEAIRVKPQVFREVCKDAAADEEGGEEVATNLQARVISPGMQLGVTVAEDSSLNRGYAVPPTCAIDFAAAGRLRVCGLTTEELATKLKTALEQDYFQKATVEVVIESVHQERKRGKSSVIYVLGGVGRPGPMRLPSGDSFTVTKAIIAAGGLTTFANGGSVKVVRHCEDGRKYETFINVASIMKTGYFDRDVPLQNNDWVIVPKKMFSFF